MTMTMSANVKEITLNILRKANEGVDTESLWDKNNLTQNGDVTWINDELIQTLAEQGYELSDIESAGNVFTTVYTTCGGEVISVTISAEEILPAEKTYNFVPFEPGWLAGMQSAVGLTADEVRKYQEWWATISFEEQRRYMHRINANKQVEAFEDHGHTRVINGKITRIPDIKIRVVYNVL